MRDTLLIFLFLTLAVLGNSQSDAKKNELAIGFGVSHHLIKDLNFARFKYQGSGSGVNLAYQRKLTNDNLLFVRTNVFVANIQSDFSDFTDTKNTKLNLQLGYLFRLKIPHPKLRFHLGGSFQSHIDLLDYEGFEALSYFNLHSVNLSTSIGYQLNSKSRLLCDIDLPLFGVLVRPPHTGWDHTINTTSTLDLFYSGSMEIIGKFKAWNIQLAYQYQLKPRLAFQIQASNNHKYTNENKEVVAASFYFSAAVHFKF